MHPGTEEIRISIRNPHYTVEIVSGNLRGEPRTTEVLAWHHGLPRSPGDRRMVARSKTYHNTWSDDAQDEMVQTARNATTDERLTHRIAKRLGQLREIYREEV